MRFLIDANMPRSIMRSLRVLDTKSNLPATLAWRPLSAGIIVLRLSDGVIARDIAGVTERFLRDATFVGNLAGRLAIVEQDRVRFRPPLA